MSADVNAVKKFLASVRRRLWFVVWLDGLRSVLWSGSFALVLLAAIHVWLVRVPSWLLLLTLTAISAVVLVKILRHRPSSLQAAAQADRRFSGHAVMTTALECLPRAPLAESGASNVVLTQAGRAARAWQPDLKHAFVATTHTSSTVALVPLFVAIMLLSRPGAESQYEAAAVASPEVPQTTRNEEQNAAAESGDATLRDGDVIVSSTDQGASEVFAADDALLPGEGPVASQEDTLEVPVAMDRDQLSVGTARSNGESGDLAGGALPNETSSENDAASQERIRRGASVAIERTGPSRATADASDLTYDETRSPAMSFVADVLPAAAPDSGRSSTTLTRAQAAYAARYLNTTGDSND